jgi:hypothetical protein
MCIPSLCFDKQKQQVSHLRIFSETCHAQSFLRGQRLRKHVTHML